MRELLNRALDRHAEEPAAAAAVLLSEALPLAAGAGDDDLQALARTAEHVLLGHLADGPGLQNLVAALPQREALRPSRQRIAAALALAAGEPAPPWQDLAPAERIRAHYNAALACTRRDDLAAARRLLDRARAEAEAASDDAAARKAIAAVANNIAGDLRYYHRPGDAAREALMLDAAALAQAAWARAGGWLELERAEWQLARCAAAAGQGERALVHARECLRICDEQQADEFERFYGLEALAHAALAAQQGDVVARARAAMRESLPRLPETDQPAARESLAAVEALLERG